MAEKVRFDGPNKLIIINNGQTQLNAQADIYSAWKRWLHLSTISASGGYGVGPSAAPAPAFLQALRTIGGDPTVVGQYVSPYYFLMNDWKIRPYEGSHHLTIDGNLYVDGGVGSPFVETNGDFNVLVTQNVANIATATIQVLEIANLQRLIETGRAHHTGTGNIWYWNPYGGSDAAAGTAQATAFKTFAKTHDSVVQNNHDIIICVPGDPSGITTSTEPIVITKNYVFVRGPGRDFKIKPNVESDSVTITSNGVEISSIIVETKDGGSANAVNIHDCDFTLLKSLWFNDSAGYSICISGSDYTSIDDCHIDHGKTDGIRVHDDIHDLTIKNTEINHCDGNGVNIMGNNVWNTRINPSQINANEKYGISISPGASGTEIHVTSISENVSGAVFDEGVATTYVGDLEGDRTKNKILDETLSLHTCGGSVADVIAQIKKLANLIPAGV